MFSANVRVTSAPQSSVGYYSILFLPVSSLLKSYNAVISAEDSTTIVPLAQLNEWLSSQNPEHMAILHGSGGFHTSRDKS